MKLPSLQFYIGDWMKDPTVKSLTLEEKGAWVELLMYMWESPKRGMLLYASGEPIIDTQDLGRLLSVDSRVALRIVGTLVSKGVASRDEESKALICRRMVKDEQIRDIRAESGQKGGSRKNSTNDVNFERFWAAYPNKTGKLKALESWNRVNPNDELVATILAAVETQKNSQQWRKDAGQFIPHPATWLNQGRWNDEAVKTGPYVQEPKGGWTSRNKNPATGTCQHGEKGACQKPPCFMT